MFEAIIHILTTQFRIYLFSAPFGLWGLMFYLPFLTIAFSRRWFHRLSALTLSGISTSSDNNTLSILPFHFTQRTHKQYCCISWLERTDRPTGTVLLDRSNQGWPILSIHLFGYLSGGFGGVLTFSWNNRNHHNTSKDGIYGRDQKSFSPSPSLEHFWLS